MEKIVSFVSLIAISFVTVSAHALSVSSGYTQMSSGAYVKETRITCSADESALCQSLCANDTVCNRQEPYCLNCAGTSSTFLRTLFTQISQNYTATQREIPDEALVRYLGQASYILIGAKSVFNYYVPLNSEQFVENLRALCPDPTDDPLLAIELTKEQQPKKLSFVLCQNGDMKSKAYDVDLQRPAVGGQVFNLEAQDFLRLDLKIK